MTQCHLMDLYGTYSCTVVQNESKECGTISLHRIALKIQFVLLDCSSQFLSANCLYLLMEAREFG